MAKVQNLHLQKEARRLLEDKVANMPLDTEKRLISISNSIEAALQKKDVKIKRLINKVDEKFKPGSPERGMYEGLATLSFDTAYALYLQNNNSALVLELQGLLERFCLNALEDMLPIDDKSKSVVSSLLEKKTLKDVASYMESLGSWTSDDVIFALELTKLRNGIAHKNAELVSRSKLVNSDGQNRHYESIHSMMSMVDCAEWIVRTMDLIIKGSRLSSPSYIKQPRLYARYYSYSAVIGELYDLFLTNPYGQKHDPRLEAYVNHKLAHIYVIGSEELVQKLEVYKSEVLKFHKALDDDNDDLALSIYAGFDKSLNEVVLALRKDLMVDHPGKELIERQHLIDIKPYITNA